MISICFALMLAGAQAPAPAAPPPATAVIRGQVTAGDTGQPLRRATVRLNQIDGQTGVTTNPGRESRTQSTDAEGKYAFHDLPAGRYNLSVSKGAYVTVTWGQQPGPTASTGKPIDLHAAETLERVDVTLPRGGVVTGRVVDEFGEPLTGLQITAMRAQTIGGKRQLMPAGNGSTDDAGAFRLFGLAPGQYYVQALWRRMGPGDPNSPDHNGYPVTFFPGTTNDAEAQRITVAAGQTIGDLVMAMAPITVARVEGIVVDADGRPMGNGVLEVQQSSGNNNFFTGQSLRPDGTFALGSLTPGDYILRAQSQGASKAVATMKLTVSGEDITDLRLVAMPPSIVKGRIVVDPSLTVPAAISVMAMIDDQRMPGGIQPARVDDDLSFELSATPGRNRIIASNLPAGWAIRTVRVNNVDVTDDGFEVKPGENIAGVDVELTNRLATISGLVTTARGEPAKEYTLVLFAADAKRWKASGRYLRTARPDQDGRFKVSGMAPADYHIIAIDKLEPGQWTDPEFLERMRSKAASITIGDGETRTLDLKINTAS
jgi:carboxypeptidase family protein